MPRHYLGVDHLRVATIATEHLVECGYRRIGLLLGNTRYPRHRLYQQGFQQAHATAGVVVDRKLVTEIELNLEQGYAATERLMKERRPPEALVVRSDRASLDCLKALQNLSVQVPREVGVLAMDRPSASRGCSAFPQVRFVSLVENGTHVLFGTRMGGFDTGEITLAKQVLPSLTKGRLCLADRNLFGFELWNQARSTGADLLWRLKKNLRLPCEKRLPDGSYLSRVYASPKEQRRRRNGVVVRVIEYRLEGIPGAEPVYRLLTTILDHEAGPATDLPALYHERWEIETVLDELKTHLRGARIVLRSKTPDLVRQEFYGLMMAHFAVRGLRHEAAFKANEDPDKLSFLQAVRVVRRKIARFASIPPSGHESIS